MNHPTLPPDAVTRFVTEVLVKVALDQDLVDEFVVEHAEGHPSALRLDEVESVAASLTATAIANGGHGTALEDLETEFAVPVFEAFRSLPGEALGDVDFWTYCSALYFWQFITLRQQSSVVDTRKAMLPNLLEPAEVEEEEPRFPLTRYVIGNDHYHIPLRLYLRGQAVGGDAQFLRDHPIRRGTDFWRSHVLAVTTGAHPSWARAIVAAQSDRHFPTKRLRTAAKRVNRIRANVSLTLHDDDEAAALIAPVWSAVGAMTPETD